MAVLQALGYQPCVPVPLSDLRDSEKRRTWNEERNMVAFTLRSAAYPLTEIDIMLAPPLGDYAAVAARSVDFRLGDGVTVPVIGRADLIALKRAAGRLKDLDDVRALLALNEAEVADDGS